MYKNLTFEIKNSNLKQKDIARNLQISASLLSKKIKGVIDFNLNECLKIRSLLKNKRFSLGYLFEKGEQCLK